MADYIDRKALIEHIKDLPTWWGDGGGIYGKPMKYPDGMFDTEDVVSSIENAPAADVVPVRHGKWKCQSDCGVTACSTCGWNIEEYVGDYHYCPNCGAKMDGEKQ